MLLTFSFKANLETASPRLASILGRQVVSGLWSTRDTDSRIRVTVDQDSTPYAWNGPVLMVWPTAKMLNRVGEIRDVTAEVVVPWMAGTEGIAEWINAWAPTPIGAATATSKSSTLSPQVLVALQRLTDFINFGNGLVTKSDREEAIQVFETLIAFEPALNIGDVRAWLVSEGKWPGDVADEAKSILDDLEAGKKLRGRRGPDRARYDRWIEAAKTDVS
ncbi:MAG: hypothetical protein ACREJD_08465 [Phycisphaerales bacterium]